MATWNWGSRRFACGAGERAEGRAAEEDRDHAEADVTKGERGPDVGAAPFGPGGFDVRGWLAQLPRHGWTVAMLEQFPEQFRFDIVDGELLLPSWVWDSKTPIPEE